MLDVEKDKAPTISLKDCKVYGPGLSANFTVPVRYFFIQLIDTEQKSFSSSPQSLSIQVSGVKVKCRIWYQLLQIKEGLFIARYRLYETCVGIQIDIVYENQLVAEAPYIIEGPVFHEQCYCPKPINEWLSNLNCPSSYSQIDHDLKIFPEIDMRNALEDALKRFNHPGSYSICHYSIISNQIYRKCFGQYVGFSMFMDEILLSLTRKMYLPDMEFIANLGDWPLEQRSEADNPIPIFSWCGSKSTKDIVMPTYDITEATLEMMGRVMVDILSVMGNSGPSWEEKIQMAFWRGRDKRKKLSMDQNLNIFLFSIFSRYQINIDGTVAAYRLPYLIAGGSLVLKQESDFYEYFYNDIQPMVHYVPFNRNLSNLVEKLQWAIDHDDEAKKIAENAQEFALSNLMPKDILCYYAVLFKEYSTRLKSNNIVVENMEHIKQPIQKSCFCPDEEKFQDMYSKDEL
ncbi:protein O-glucosyltransferase 2 [Caerostris darwini]|uniref:Protein O-glucosyltransferase 2 n=1 Tax=Caerostris darwini TaxID=1538125 RepID=A0AAV4TK11_9ARAC|nr:protein O-glucosyltransferase 2 [Caerostris darwini]